MAGSIFFQKNHWPASAHLIFYVFEYLAERSADPEISRYLNELEAANVPILDLRERDQRELVNLIADDLPHHIENIEDPQLRHNLSIELADLIAYAKEQQTINEKSG